MPLILERQHVLEVYAEAAERKWVLPAFNSENLTSSEAVLAAVSEYGRSVGMKDLPIIIGITNKYSRRPQSVYYTHTRRWEVGLRLFLADLKVLTSQESPFGQLRVMVHLDHIRWDQDEELLDWDMRLFSSIMYDASTLPLEQNIEKTAAFMEKKGDTILIEGACDEIGEATAAAGSGLTTPDLAEKYHRQTGVDLVVANLGTEHRATAAKLQFHSELAREITARIGPRLCLHGTSSVSARKLKHLFDDGVRKVNIWTTLERDSSPTLFQNMLENAAKVVGREKAEVLLRRKLLGPGVDYTSGLSSSYYTTTYRQGVVFQRMKEIVTHYLEMWYA